MVDEIVWCWFWVVESGDLLWNWAEQVDGRALGVLVTEEVRVQFLVSLQGDTTALVVLLLYSHVHTNTRNDGGRH